jgi:hypothetical protein
MSKAIKVSADGGTTWKTLPGSTGSINRTGSKLNDTIFGQDFQSQQPGIISWTIGANSFYKGFAGYVAKLKKMGSTTAFTGEAMSVVSGKTYKITNAAKNFWDRSVAATIKDDGTEVDAADIANIDYLFGQVTFVDDYTPAGAITADGSYFPTATFGWGSSIKLTQQLNALDESTFDLVQGNGGYQSYRAGLKTVSYGIDGIQDAANGLPAILEARTEYLLELNPDGNGKSVARGFFKLTEDNESGDVGAIEQESTTWDLFVPVTDLLKYPFAWQHASDTTLPAAVKIILDAWQTGSKIKVQYLEDGVNGEEGDCIVTECSLATGITNMNEFTVNLQGCGALTAAP